MEQLPPPIPQPPPEIPPNLNEPSTNEVGTDLESLISLQGQTSPPALATINIPKGIGTGEFIDKFISHVETFKKNLDHMDEQLSAPPFNEPPWDNQEVQEALKKAAREPPIVRTGISVSGSMGTYQNPANEQECHCKNLSWKIPVGNTFLEMKSTVFSRRPVEDTSSPLKKVTAKQQDKVFRRAPEKKGDINESWKNYEKDKKTLSEINKNKKLADMQLSALAHSILQAVKSETSTDENINKVRDSLLKGKSFSTNFNLESTQVTIMSGKENLKTVTEGDITDLFQESLYPRPSLLHFPAPELEKLGLTLNQFSHNKQEFEKALKDNWGSLDELLEHVQVYARDIRMYENILPQGLQEMAQWNEEVQTAQEQLNDTNKELQKDPTNETLLARQTQLIDLLKTQKQTLEAIKNDEPLKDLGIPSMWKKLEELRTAAAHIQDILDAIKNSSNASGLIFKTFGINKQQQKQIKEMEKILDDFSKMDESFTEVKTTEHDLDISLTNEPELKNRTSSNPSTEYRNHVVRPAQQLDKQIQKLTDENNQIEKNLIKQQKILDKDQATDDEKAAARDTMQQLRQQKSDLQNRARELREPLSKIESKHRELQELRSFKKLVTTSKEYRLNFPFSFKKVGKNAYEKWVGFWLKKDTKDESFFAKRVEKLQDLTGNEEPVPPPEDLSPPPPNYRPPPIPPRGQPPLPKK